MVCFHLGTNYIDVSNDWSRRQSTMIRIYRGTSRNLSTDVYCFVKSSFQIDSASELGDYLMLETFQFFQQVAKKSQTGRSMVFCAHSQDIKRILEVSQLYKHSGIWLCRISNVLGSRFFRECLYTCDMPQASPETSMLRTSWEYHLAWLLANS